MTLIEITLIVFAFLAIYNFVVYPVLLFFLSKIIAAEIKPVSTYQPEITFVIAAHNEESLIEATIKSIKESDYPANKITILIGSDGSTDRTNEIIKQIVQQDSSIKLIELIRQGKNNVLNSIVPLAETKIILFMDADVRLQKDTVSKLMRYFANDEVGGVIASQMVVGDGITHNAGSDGDSLYHKYEKNIRINEAIIASNVNSLGYLYAIKKELFIPVPNNLVCDDLHNIYSVLSKNKRVIFAKDAIAYEIRPKSLKNEFHRRVRAVSGGWSTVAFHSELLDLLKHGKVAFFIWSHKIFRWLSPVFMAFLIIFTIWTFFINQSLALIIAAPQLILYLLALLGYFFEKFSINIKFFRVFVFFISMNYSSLLGLFRFLSKQQNATWNREGF